jgi:hypothetical protein
LTTANIIVQDINGYSVFAGSPEEEAADGSETTGQLKTQGT